MSISTRWSNPKSFEAKPTPAMLLLHVAPSSVSRLGWLSHLDLNHLLSQLSFYWIICSFESLFFLEIVNCHELQKTILVMFQIKKASKNNRIDFGSHWAQKMKPSWKLIVFHNFSRVSIQRNQFQTRLAANNAQNPPHLHGPNTIHNQSVLAVTKTAISNGLIKEQL